jgi:hypothetical protein
MDNPLVAMDALGRVILDSPSRRLGMLAIGNTLVTLAKDWTFDPACTDGMIDELRQVRISLNGWRCRFCDEHCMGEVDWIDSTILPQLNTIITVLEG